ncbi:MAG TPA: hypothetical protein VNO86_08715 [Candidatus Binatia bacterium]|nr:hypothetical protein [Candidatus Binatia bacterium]
MFKLGQAVPGAVPGMEWPRPVLDDRGRQIGWLDGDPDSPAADSLTQDELDDAFEDGTFLETVGMGLLVVTPDDVRQRWPDLPDELTGAVATALADLIMESFAGVFAIVEDRVDEFAFSLDQWLAGEDLRPHHPLEADISASRRAVVSVLWQEARRRAGA